MTTAAAAAGSGRSRDGNDKRPWSPSAASSAIPNVTPESRSIDARRMSPDCPPPAVGGNKNLKRQLERELFPSSQSRGFSGVRRRAGADGDQNKRYRIAYCPSFGGEGCNDNDGDNYDDDCGDDTGLRYGRQSASAIVRGGNNNGLVLVCRESGSSISTAFAAEFASPRFPPSNSCGSKTSSCTTTTSSGVSMTGDGNHAPNAISSTITTGAMWPSALPVLEVKTGGAGLQGRRAMECMLAEGCPLEGVFAWREETQV